MRIVKDAEERRNDILDAAEELFAVKGFDNTGTADILEKVGIARGTLYYHFKSKEEILNALIDRTADRMVVKAQAAASDSSLSLPDRLCMTLMALNMQEPGLGEEMLSQLHKPQNALMHQKQQEIMVRKIVPIIAGMVEEGISQGMFSTPYPREAVEMIIIYSNYAFDDMNVQSGQDRMRSIMAFVFHTERILGADKGSLSDLLMRILSNSAHGGTEE